MPRRPRLRLPVKKIADSHPPVLRAALIRTALSYAGYPNMDSAAHALGAGSRRSLYSWMSEKASPSVRVIVRLCAMMLGDGSWMRGTPPSLYAEEVINLLAEKSGLDSGRITELAGGTSTFREWHPQVWWRTFELCVMLREGYNLASVSFIDWQNRRTTWVDNKRPRFRRAPAPLWLAADPLDSRCTYRAAAAGGFDEAPGWTGNDDVNPPFGGGGGSPTPPKPRPPIGHPPGSLAEKLEIEARLKEQAVAASAKRVQAAVAAMYPTGNTNPDGTPVYNIDDELHASLTEEEVSKAIRLKEAERLKQEAERAEEERREREAAASQKRIEVAASRMRGPDSNGKYTLADGLYKKLTAEERNAALALRSEIDAAASQKRIDAAVDLVYAFNGEDGNLKYAVPLEIREKMTDREVISAIRTRIRRDGHLTPAPPAEPQSSE